MEMLLRIVAQKVLFKNRNFRKRNYLVVGTVRDMSINYSYWIAIFDKKAAEMFIPQNTGPFYP